MSWLSEGHAEWHTVHGQYATCPLDCGANEPWVDECPGCGGLIVTYPSDPGHPTRDCPDPAACDAVMAEATARWEAERAAEAGRRRASFPDPPF